MNDVRDKIHHHVNVTKNTSKKDHWYRILAALKGNDILDIEELASVKYDRSDLLERVIDTLVIIQNHMPNSTKEKPIDNDIQKKETTMTKTKKDSVAVIDMGSNAIRLAIGARDEAVYKKIRIPIRLGVDVFSSGSIRSITLKQVVDVFESFKQEMKNCQVDRLRVVATSAVRNSRNRQEMADLVYHHLDVELEVIDGYREAVLVHRAVRESMDIQGQAVLMDIGGGSVELIDSFGGNFQKMISLPLGTLRVFKQARDGDNKAILKFVEGFRERVREFIDYIGRPVDILIGIGGNVECFLDLKEKILSMDSSSHLFEDELKKITNKLLSMSGKKRERKLKMHPHRSDVIIQACYICKMMMEVSKCSLMAIPSVGLRDGLLWEMFCLSDKYP